MSVLNALGRSMFRFHRELQSVNRHAHVSGRPREYISRKHFYHGCHRPAIGRLPAMQLIKMYAKEMTERQAQKAHNDYR